MKKRFKIFFLFVTILFAFSFTISAQDDEGENHSLPDGLSLSNQMKYSYDLDKNLEIFEDWFNLDYQKSIFTAGIRLDTYQPNDPNPSINRGKKRMSDLSFKYFKVEIGDKYEGAELTVGNYYALFGRGLVLKSYEDRNVRIDNNLLGVKIAGRYKDFIMTLLTGMPENTGQTRSDILHAFDIEFKGLKFVEAGVTIASNQPDIDGAARTTMTSFRIEPKFWNFDLYAEYGIKQNDDIKENVFKGERKIAGKAIYTGLNFYYESFSVSGEYKLYDNFGFTSNDGTVSYNTPPAVRKDYAYSLINQHPSPLDQNNEQGFQVEANYNIDDNTYTSVTYGITKTLDASSLYQQILNNKVDVRTQFKEFFVQLSRTWSDVFHTTAAFGYSEELSSNTKNITPIFEARYAMDKLNSIRFIFEHQSVTDRSTSEQYYDQAVTLEYLRSPKLSIGVVGEMQSREVTPGRIIRKTWKFVQFGYKLGEHTNLSLLFGSRQAGNICIGGVCRYEPEFNGIELKMLTRF